MPPPVCHHAWLSTELDMLSGIIHSIHLQSLFSVLSIFSYFRLKVASAKCLLDLKHLSQNTSTLPDTRAHKYAFQCYSLIFTFKSRIFSLESTTLLSNTWLCGLSDVLSKYRAFCTYIYKDWNGGETSLLILELGTVGRAEKQPAMSSPNLCFGKEKRLANKLHPKDLNSASWGHPLLRVCWWGRPGMDKSPPSTHTFVRVAEEVLGCWVIWNNVLSYQPSLNTATWNFHWSKMIWVSQTRSVPNGCHRLQTRPLELLRKPSFTQSLCLEGQKQNI